MIGMLIVGISLLCVSNTSCSSLPVLQGLHICSDGENALMVKMLFPVAPQVPFAKSISGLIGPNGGLGFAIGKFIPLRDIGRERKQSSEINHYRINNE